MLAGFARDPYRSNGTCNALGALRVPTRENQIQLGVAQMEARVIWDHEAAGSRPATETRQTCAWVWP